MAAKPPSNLLTVREACTLLHIHPNTLRRWGEIGVVRVYRVGPRRDRRFRREDVERMVEGGEGRDNG
jgi:excisionase family DNA binding protein